MGMFLSMTSVVGKSKSELVDSLSKYAAANGGGLAEEELSIENDNCCVLEEAYGNTTIFNPYAFLQWDESSEFLSRDLNAPVFSFHIHDGDLWMYSLYVNGELVDQFNPIPDYWTEDISDQERLSWRGNAEIVAKYLITVEQADIEKYLVNWDLDAEESIKAYDTDEYVQEDWQLLDFMKKSKLPYPLDDNGNPKAQTYKLWTKQLPIRQLAIPTPKTPLAPTPKKPRWKFW
jgi:hypothetical protein